MRRPVQNDENAKVKLRLIEFEVEGGNPAILESLRTMATAITRQKQTPARVLAAPTPTMVDKPDEMSPQGEIDFGEVEDVPPDPIENLAEGSSRIARPRAPRKPPVPPAPIQLDIKAGNPSFADFIERAGSPESDWQRYLAVGYWLKHHYTSPIQAITLAHVYTCYRLMGWTVPKNVSIPLRDITRKKQWFKKETAGYVITTFGENEIEKAIAQKSK